MDRGFPFIAFPLIYYLSSLSSICNFYSMEGDNISWDLHFFRNLNERDLLLVRPILNSRCFFEVGQKDVDIGVFL